MGGVTYTVGENRTVTLILKDRFGNDVSNISTSTEMDYNRVNAELVNKVDESIVFPAAMGYGNSTDGFIDLHFNVTKSGSYRLEIDDVAFPVPLPRENDFLYAATNLSLGNSIVSVPATVTAGVASKIVLTLNDVFGNTLNLRDEDLGIDFVAEINSTDQGGNFSAPFALDESDLLSATLNLTKAAGYNITIAAYNEIGELLQQQFANLGKIAGNPFPLTVSPAEPKYENFNVTDPSGCLSEIVAGVGCTAGFTALDEFGNVIIHNDNIGDVNIKNDILFQPANASASNSLEISPISGKPSYLGNGGYMLTFTPTIAGTYARDPLVFWSSALATEKDIPFNTTLVVLPHVPAATDNAGVATTTYQVMPKNVVAGDNFTVTIDLRDKFGNEITLENKTTVLIHIQLDFSGEAAIPYRSLEESDIESLSPLAISVNLTTADSVLARLRVGGILSPLEVYFEVVSDAVHAPLSYATFNSPAVAGNYLEVTVFAHDVFNNEAEQHGMSPVFMENVGLLASSGSTGVFETIDVSRYTFDETLRHIVKLDFNLTKAGQFALDLNFYNASLLRTVEATTGSNGVLMNSGPINQGMSTLCLDAECLQRDESHNFETKLRAGEDTLLSVIARDDFENRIPSVYTEKAEALKYRFTCVVTNIDTQSGSEITEENIFYTEYLTSTGRYEATMNIFGWGMRHLHIFHQYHDISAVAEKVDLILEWNPFLERWNASETQDFYLSKSTLEDHVFSKVVEISPKVCVGNTVGTGTGVECVCSPGYYLAGQLCMPCPKGFFKDGKGNATECTQCESQFTTKDEASARATDCVCNIGFYQNNPGDRECLRCPDGGICPTVATLSTLLLIPGKWRSSPNSTMILDCQRRENCVGGLTTDTIDEKICKEGHTGVVCSVCKEGYKPSVFDNGSCEVCEEVKESSMTWGKWVAFCIALIFFFVLLSFLVKRRKHQGLLALQMRGKHQDKRKLSLRARMAMVREVSPVPLIKIFYNYTVHVSVGTILKVKMSAILKGFLQSSDSVASGGIDLGMSVMFEGCSSPVPGMNYYGQLTLVLLIPVGLILFSALFFITLYIINDLFLRKGGRSRETVTHKIGAKMMDPSLEFRGNHKSQAAEHATSWVVSVLILMFMVHSAVASKSFVVFNCFEYEKDKFVIESDYSLTCDMGDRDYKNNYLKGLMGIVFYGLGIPMTIFGLLYANRKRLDDRQVLELYGFIYDGFRKEFYWWEVFIMMRKLAIAFCMVALSYYPFLQAFCAAGLMVLYLVSHVAASPFEHKVLNDLESFSLSCSAFTLQCCILYTRHREPGEDAWIGQFEEGLSVALVMVNMFFVLLMLSSIVGAIINSLKRAVNQHNNHTDNPLSDDKARDPVKNDPANSGSPGEKMQNVNSNPLYSPSKQERTAYPNVSYDAVKNNHATTNGGGGGASAEDGGGGSMMMSFGGGDKSTSNPLVDQLQNAKSKLKSKK